MNNLFRQMCRVKPISAYLRKSIKFYEMDKPLVAQIVFVVLLGVIFGGYIFMGPFTQELNIAYQQVSVGLMEQVENMELNISSIDWDLYNKMLNSLFTVSLIVIVIKSISFLISLFYGCWYYFSRTEPSLECGKRVAAYFKRLPKFVLFNILFYVALYIVAIAALIIFLLIAAFVPFLLFLVIMLPVSIIVIDKIFTFKDLMILEFDIGVFRNFKKSLDLTKGCKKNVVLNSLWPFIFGWLVNYFALSIGNQMFSLLVTSFVEVIVLLFSQRLTVNMFIDATSLESGK